MVTADWGYTVLSARSHLEAIEVLAESGLTPGILITGDTTPDRIREAISHDVTLLHKPIHPSDRRIAIFYILMRRVLLEKMPVYRRRLLPRRDWRRPHAGGKGPDQRSPS